MMGIVRQIRLSSRALIRNPGFTIPALLILAVGMTAATAVFTVVDSVVFRPLDLPEARRVVIVCEKSPQIQEYCIASPGNVEDFRKNSSTLAEIGIGRSWGLHLTDSEGTERVSGGLASAGFLRALGVQPALGRLFANDEHGPDNDKVALLSHAYWTSRYGASPAVLGSSVDLSGDLHQVIGVLPEGLVLPFDMGRVEVLKPLHISPLSQQARSWRGFRAIGRLADGASVAAASEELTGIYRGIGELHEEVDDEWRLLVQPLLREVLGDTRPVMLAFLAAAGLLLLIVCANVANLLLARGLTRRQELAVRAALGAERARLAKELLVESLVLSSVAGGVAILLSGAATRVLIAIAPSGIPRLDQVATDARVLLFVVLLSAAMTVFFALLPALKVTAWDLSQALKSGTRSGDTAGSIRLQHGLVVAELALSVVLLSSAALLTRSFVSYLEWDPGFDPEPLVSVLAFLNPGKYATSDEFMAVFRHAEELVAAVPGVAAVSTASAGPLFGGADGATPFATDGQDPTGPLPSAEWYDIGPSYFQTIGLPLRSGREFTEADGPGAPPVAVVNETLARRAWPDGNAVGQVLHLPERGVSLEVVGVVADMTPITPGAVAPPEVYWSNRQFGRIVNFFVVRASVDPATLVQPLREALLRADPDASVGTPRAFSTEAARQRMRPRFQALVLLGFALVAMVLTAVGVYAVVSYAVARRTREVGIRVALGAGDGQVVKLMARSSLAVVAVGLGLGLGGSLIAGSLIQGMIPGVTSTDAVSLAAGCGGLLLVASLAILVPARRATRVDPLTAMRIE